MYAFRLFLWNSFFQIEYFLFYYKVCFAIQFQLITQYENMCIAFIIPAGLFGFDKCEELIMDFS